MVATVVSSLSSSFTPFAPYSFSSPSIHDSPPYSTQSPPRVQTDSAAGGGGNGRISPAMLFIIVILAAIFFISGLLHLLVRLLMKKQHHRGASRGIPPRRRTGQARVTWQWTGSCSSCPIYMILVWTRPSLMPCLCLHTVKSLVVARSRSTVRCAREFDGEDRLRLLPVCGHAFHLQCIDTWLLSNSTCPLCRGTLFVPGMTIDSLMFDFDERLEEEPLPDECEDGFQISRQKPSDEEQPAAEKRVFPVRLGKFKNVGDQGAIGAGVGNGNAAGIVSMVARESSSSSLDARRCFFMGTYQYVLGHSELRVALQPGCGTNGASSRFRGRAAGLSFVNAEIMEGKRICARKKGESFSVSKIWQWSSVKGKLPAGSHNCSDTGNLP